MTATPVHGPPVRVRDRYDVLLLDLDGVVYTGGTAVPGAVPALVTAQEHGLRLVYVTNNASRTPQQVADHLVALGLTVTADDVVTSAEAVADQLAADLHPGCSVLVVGGEGLREAVARRGFRVVERADHDPVAVVQGFGPDVGWRELAEAAYAIGGGATWMVTNRDLTLPTDRGLAPGNGTMVAALEVTTGRHPAASLGKPEPGLFRAAVRRTGAQRPLVVGDRLDTDVAGARRCGIPSLLVLTGVTGVESLLAAPPEHRPDLLLNDLTGLAEPVPTPQPDPGSGAWVCGGFAARPVAGQLVLEGGGAAVDAVRCSAAAAWTAADTGAALDVCAVVDLLEPQLRRRR